MKRVVLIIVFAAATVAATNARACQVRFHVRVVVSGDDPEFGFYSRPIKAQVIGYHHHAANQLTEIEKCSR